MALNFQHMRDLLREFKFEDLFIEELGWSQPTRRKPIPLEVEEKAYEYKCIAEVSGVAVFEVTATDGTIPEAKVRTAIHQEITKLKAENLLIFIDETRTRSLWYWIKREGRDAKFRVFIRDHLYVKGQPGDLFLSKLGSLVIDITELEDDSLSVVKIAHRLQKAFDVERVTKQFYKDFQEEHKRFLGYVKGINNESDRRWYTSVILNRLMFVYFLQRKGFIDKCDEKPNGNFEYLQNKLEASKQRGEDLFYSEFLKILFFDTFAKPEIDRDPFVKALVGNVKYLNGGLFLKHRIEQEYNISIADEAFEKLLELFAGYSWNLDDTPEGKDDEINPDVLGYIFEKYINQKAFGAYYTRPQITEYLCDRTIHKLIVDRVNEAIPDKYKQFEDINQILLNKEPNIYRLLFKDILPNLSILDPACGSGAFLIAAMKTLIQVYSAAIGSIKLIGDANLKTELQELENIHKSLAYYIKKRVVTDNLYGVDIMEEATEIAKLRLFLALVSSAHHVDELEPLPNIDDKWNLRLTAEFHMTNDSHLFKQQPGKGRVPLYEGKMIHQFTHKFAEPKYWVDEQEGRKAVLGRNGKDEGQDLDYQCYRLAYRSVAASTNERSLIASVLPQNVFFGHSMNASIIHEKGNDGNLLINSSEILFVTACLNSFIFDFGIRQRVSQNLTMFYIYQMSIPRLIEGDKYFSEIVQRAAKLICTTPEFDELAQEVGLGSHANGVTDESDRAKIRAELDGIIAHLYRLTEDEFAYILTTFPIVKEQVKADALAAYREFAPLTGD